MNDYDNNKVLLDRIRTSHLGLIFVSLVTIFAVNTVFFQQHSLFRELEVVESLLKSYPDMAKSIDTTVNLAVREGLENRILPAKSFYDAIVPGANISHETISFKLKSNNTNIFQKSIWDGFIGIFQDDIKLEQGYFPDSSLSSNSTISPFHFVKLWSLLSDNIVFLAVTGAEKDYFHLEQNNTIKCDDKNLEKLRTPLHNDVIDTTQLGLFEHQTWSYSIQKSSNLKCLPNNYADNIGFLEFNDSLDKKLIAIPLNTVPIDINFHDRLLTPLRDRLNPSEISTLKRGFPALGTLFNLLPEGAYRNMPVQELKDFIEKLKKLQSEKTAIFGLTAPLHMFSPWGAVLVSIFMLLHSLHLRQLPKTLNGQHGWFGLYPSTLTKVLVIGSSLVLPLVAIFNSVTLSATNEWFDYLVLIFALFVSIFATVHLFFSLVLLYKKNKTQV